MSLAISGFVLLQHGQLQNCVAPAHALLRLSLSVPKRSCQSARKTDPRSASNFDPLVAHGGERPTGWSWSGLRSPVGRG